MNDAQAVVGLDRLPWLTDEPKRALPQRARFTNMRDLLGLALAAVLLVAALSYWMGIRTGRTGEEAVATSPRTPGATVKLPEARDVGPEVQLPAAPEVSPAPAPTVEISEPTAERPVRRYRAPAKRKLSPMRLEGSELAQTVSKQEVAPAKPTPALLASRSQQRLWPATESKGASGRIVRIGSFGSRQQAKLGWRRMQRVYPAVGRLPATVVTDRNSRGRYFYRFQIGTTSQAHSEVLCQRMEKMLRFSCAVVGLPGKAKVER
jgi:hypothetical protein